MWALLSSRLRTWLLFAVAVPAIRTAVRIAARRAAAANPGGRGARVLGQADSTLTRFSRRGRRLSRAAA
jgi:hypothetical protein